MPALPLWGIVVLAIVVAIVIIGLLVCLFRCRRFPGSTVDPAEYSAKKQGFHSIVTEATSTSNSSTHEEKIAMRPTTPSPTTTTVSSSSSQPCTPTTSSCSPSSAAHAYSDKPLSETHHEFVDRPIKSNAPSTSSFFTDKMPPDDEAKRMSELYTLGNKEEFISIDLSASQGDTPAFYNTISHLQLKTTGTVKSTTYRQSLGRQKSPPAPHKPACVEENATSSNLDNDEGKPNMSLSLPPIYQSIDDDVHNQASNPNVTDTIRTVESQKILEYTIDSMFAWPSTEEEDDDDNRQSISSIIQGDTMSITSGSVHRLVRDSTVIDTDHRSLAARSVANSVRPSLHDMASWWSKENQSVDQMSNTDCRPLSPSSKQPSSHHSSMSISTTKSSSITTSKASIYTSSPKSTFSRATLNKFRIALANEESDDEVEATEIQTAPLTFCDTTTESTPPPISPVSTESPISPESPSTEPHEEEEEEENDHTSMIKSRPSSTVSTVSSQHLRIISPIPEFTSVESPTIRSSPRNSTIGHCGLGNTDSMRRILNRNTNRLSDQGSIASARTALSQGMSPPGSVNPRQLNQHLASLSIQSRLQNRPGLP
ncbi:hypothetical protein BC941DRAFT_432785 [Chlamydoabsidia padenii]|nr:hypothetical protein BC941DRAFT_432785 [Chlamydoabsidia padenii]